MERQSFSAKIFPKPSSSGIVYKDKNHFSHLWTQQNRSTEGKSPNMSTNEGKKKKKGLRALILSPSYSRRRILLSVPCASQASVSTSVK